MTLLIAKALLKKAFSKIPLWVYGVLLVVLMYLGVLWYGSSERASGYDSAMADRDAEIAAAKAAHLLKVIEIEAGWQKKMDDEVSIYIEALEKGYAKRDKIISGLRSGNIKLREHWQGCSPNGMPETSGNSERVAENTRLREEAAGDIIRLGSSCDAEISALQRALMITRGEGSE